jgi:gliding motility-associated protein GldM
MSTRGMSLGQYQYKGVINYQGPEGEMLSEQFKTPTFTIAEPSLVVSPTKMNVFYRNLENPVRISVAGIANDKLNVRISGSHRIRRQSDGSFIVQPANNLDKEAIISVNAEMPDGSTMNLGSNTFRVKDIPDPVAMWSGIKSSNGSISVREIAGFNPLVAKMENFDFELRPSVKSFTLKVTKDGTYLEEKSNSFDFTPDMKELLNSPKRGMTIYFEDIVVSMPGGEKRKIAGLTLKVKN